MGHTFKDLPKPYTDDRLQISEIDRDNVMGGFHEIYAAGADEVEGVSGRKAIDTQYEQDSVSLVERPASLGSGQPTPVDTDRPKYPHREL